MVDEAKPSVQVGSEIRRRLTADQMAVPEVLDVAKRVQDILKGVLVEGVHYGTIPGTPKPCLWQPGAEKIDLAFRLAPSYPSTEDLSTPSPSGDPRDAEYRYRVTCVLTHSTSGLVVGSALGECSTSEEKYAWRAPRSDAEWNATPERYRRIRYEYRDEKQQVRTTPADMANTVMKMAAKRAHVSATRGATAASDVFAVDLEDVPSGSGGESTVRPKVAKPQSTRRQSKPSNGGNGGGQDHRRDFTPDEDAARKVAANIPEETWEEIRGQWTKGGDPITNPQKSRLFGIAHSKGWQPDDVRNIVKVFLGVDLEDIPKRGDYDRVVYLFSNVGPAS